MRLGDLRHLLHIERVTQTRDDDGAVVETWAPLAEAWAAVTPMSGRKLEIAQRQEPRVSHQVVMRYRPDFGVGDRFRLGKSGRVLHVLGITTRDELNDEMTILCEEVARA